MRSGKRRDWRVISTLFEVIAIKICLQRKVTTCRSTQFASIAVLASENIKVDRKCITRNKYLGQIDTADYENDHKNE